MDYLKIASLSAVYFAFALAVVVLIAELSTWLRKTARQFALAWSLIRLWFGVKFAIPFKRKMLPCTEPETRSDIFTENEIAQLTSKKQLFNRSAFAKSRKRDAAGRWTK